MQKFNIGDVILLKNGDWVEGNIPEMFVYKDKSYSKKLHEMELKIGKKYEVNFNLINEFRQKRIDSINKEINSLLTNNQKEILKISGEIQDIIFNALEPIENHEFILLEGEYLIVDVKENISPGWPINEQYFCKKLIDGKYDHSQETYYFYTSQHSKHIEREIKIVRTMTPSFI